MATENDKRILLPGPLDEFSKGLSDALDTVGSIVSESSIKSARNRLTAAEAHGVGPSVDYPWYFDIGGVVYRSTGAKNAAGVWVLSPLNEIEVEEQTRAGKNVTVTLDSGETSLGFKSSLPVRNYDRLVIATAHAVYFDVTGIVFMDLNFIGRSVARARVSSGDNETTSLTDMCVIPAGVTPNIQLLSVGGSKGSTHKWWTDAAMNRMIVQAFPITMA